MLEKLFNQRNPDKLREDILNFNIMTLNTNNITPLFVVILQKYIYIFLNVFIS